MCDVSRFFRVLFRVGVLAPTAGSGIRAQNAVEIIGKVLPKRNMGALKTRRRAAALPRSALKVEPRPTREIAAMANGEHTKDAESDP